MFRGLSLRTKLMAVGITLTIVPLLVVECVVWYQQQTIQSTAKAGCTELATSDLDHVAQQLVVLCQATDAAMHRQLASALRVASDMVRRHGPVTIAADRNVRWSATNQFTGAFTDVTLPEMQVGGKALGQVVDAKAEALVVDEVRKLVGDTCTIFQRMNAQGDMLRVCSNVLKKDGTRDRLVHPGDGNGWPARCHDLRGAGRQDPSRAHLRGGWLVRRGL